MISRASLLTAAFLAGILAQPPTRLVCIQPHDVLTLDLRTPDEQRREAVVTWARQVGVSDTLALAVTLWENWNGGRDVWSRTGCCVGPMQINVAVWFGVFDAECGGSDLLDITINACYGVHVLHYYLDQCRQHIPCALNAYSGGARDYEARVTSRWEEAERWLRSQ